MEAVQAYIKKTEVMLERLKGTHPHKERELLIGEITKLMEEREVLTMEISPPFSEEERKWGKHAISLDKELNGQLQRLFQAIKKDMRNAKQQQRSNKSYLNPYQHLASYDGKFLDSKK